MESALKAALAALALSALVSPLFAAPIILTDRLAFLAGVTGEVVADFEENASGEFTSYGPTYTGVDFTITDSNVFTVDPDFETVYQWGTGDVLDMEGDTATTTLDPPVRGIGFDFGHPRETLGTGFVTINSVDYALIGQPTFNFIGIISDMSIDPITVAWNAGLGIVDNVTVTTHTSQVSAPATIILMGIGFLSNPAIRMFCFLSRTASRTSFSCRRGILLLQVPDLERA